MTAPLRRRGEGSREGRGAEEESEEEESEEEEGDDERDEIEDDLALAAELTRRLAAGARLRTRGEVDREEGQAAARAADGAAFSDGPTGRPSFGDELMTSARRQGEGEWQQKHARHAEREEREVDEVEEYEVEEYEEVDEVEEYEEVEEVEEYEEVEEVEEYEEVEEVEEVEVEEVEVEGVEEVEVEEVESGRERLARWGAAAAFAGEHTADVAHGAAVPLARYCASGEVFSALSSRTQANNAARRGELRINGREAHGASRVRAGDLLSLHAPPPPPVSPPSLRRLERFVDTLTRATVRPESGGVAEQGSGRLQVLHEDAEVAVVFKPPGVHSAPWAGTR